MTPRTAAYQAPPSMDFPGKSMEWGATAFSEFSARKLISMTKYYGFLGKERFSGIVFLRKSNHYFNLLKNTEEFTTFY